MTEKNTGRKRAKREPSGYKNVTYYDYTLYLIINTFKFQTLTFKLEYQIMYMSDINLIIPTFYNCMACEALWLNCPKSICKQRYQILKANCLHKLAPLTGDRAVALT